MAIPVRLLAPEGIEDNRRHPLRRFRKPLTVFGKSVRARCPDAPASSITVITALAMALAGCTGPIPFAGSSFIDPGPIKYRHETIGFYHHLLELDTALALDEPPEGALRRMDTFAADFARTLCPLGFAFQDGADPQSGLTARSPQRSRVYAFDCS